MEPKKIIMNFTVPPGSDDLLVLAEGILDNMPEELSEYVEELSVEIEEFPDETTERDLDLEDPYELVALYKNGKQISPGIEKKEAEKDDVLLIYRRPLLDMWCESGDDLGQAMRQVIVEEIGRQFDFSEDEIDEMNERHHQALLYG